MSEYREDPAPEEPQAAAQEDKQQERVRQLQGAVVAGVEALAAEVAAGKSDRYIAFLEHIARFHNYSAGNQMLIYQQKPHASRIAGFTQWNRMGYWIAKGEHPIQILAPIKRKIVVVDAESGEERVVEGAPIRYKPVGVFDVSQLNQEQLKKKPLLEFFTVLGNDHAALAERVSQAIIAEGIALIEDRQGTAQGYSQPGLIAVRPELAATNRALILFHEWAHELLHQRYGEGAERSRAQKELEAEATSYVVARHFGLRNPFSADYLHDWGADPKQVMASLRAIAQAAEHIITTVEPEAVAERGQHHHRTSSSNQ